MGFSFQSKLTLAVFLYVLGDLFLGEQSDPDCPLQQRLMIRIVGSPIPVISRILSVLVFETRQILLQGGVGVDR